MRAEKNYSNILKKVLGIFLISFFLSTFIAIFVVESRENALGSDFISYLTGAMIVREGKGRLLYDLNTQFRYQEEIIYPSKETSVLPFRNLSLLAVIFIPFTFLSLLTSYKIYTFLLVLMAILISKISREAFENLSGSLWFVLPFIFYPSFGSIFAGQVSIMLLLLFLLVYFYLKKGNHLRAGLLSGLLLLKIQYIVAIPFIFFLSKNKKDFFKGLVVSSLFVVLGSVFISGLGVFKNYIYMLTNTQNPIFGTKDQSMFTLYSSLSQLTSFNKPTLFLINFFLFLFFILVFYILYKKKPLDISFVTLTLLALIFSLHGVNHDLAILVLPIWLLVNKLRDKSKQDILLVLVTFILILSPLAFVLKVSYLTSFLFLFSVALLFKAK